ncbi:MAG: hypothetical protein PHZ11_10970, partial [Desulfitobacteriaceae bacterium]|nr:hypothetical protein [Desulfitobacteriaceae bacterium]
VLQFLTFVTSNLGFMLFGPVSLPLISYGGRGLLINMCLIGFLLSIFRTGSLVSDNTEVAGIKSSRLIQYENGKIIIKLKATQQIDYVHVSFISVLYRSPRGRRPWRPLKVCEACCRANGLKENLSPS